MKLLLAAAVAALASLQTCVQAFHTPHELENLRREALNKHASRLSNALRAEEAEGFSERSEAATDSKKGPTITFSNPAAKGLILWIPPSHLTDAF